MFDFFKITSAVADLSGQMAAIRDEKEGLKREREELAAAPGMPDDVICMLTGHVDNQADKYPTFLRHMVETALVFGHTVPMGAGGCPNLGALTAVRESHARAPSAADLESSLMFFMRDQLKQALREAINQMDWPAHAKPLAGRAELLSSLDEKISKLDAAEQDLRRSAAAAGVILS